MENVRLQTIELSNLLFFFIFFNEKKFSRLIILKEINLKFSWNRSPHLWRNTNIPAAARVWAMSAMVICCYRAKIEIFLKTLEKLPSTSQVLGWIFWQFKTSTGFLHKPNEVRRVKKAYWSKIVEIFNLKRDLFLVIFPESIEKLRFSSMPAYKFVGCI